MMYANDVTDILRAKNPRGQGLKLRDTRPDHDKTLLQQSDAAKE